MQQIRGLAGRTRQNNPMAGLLVALTALQIRHGQKENLELLWDSGGAVIPHRISYGDWRLKNALAGPYIVHIQGYLFINPHSGLAMLLAWHGISDDGGQDLHQTSAEWYTRQPDKGPCWFYDCTFSR